MLSVVKDAPVKLVSMHSLSIPPTGQIVIPLNCDPVEYILAWGRSQLELFNKYGIKRERIILDPGIGFGKTPEQSLTLIKRASELKVLGVPIFIGHSRKSFHQVISAVPAMERDLETAVSSVSLFNQGVDYIRVHDVAYSLRAIAMQKRLESIQPGQEYNYELSSGTQQAAGSKTPSFTSLL
jgi:dihydropteroate synthase